MQKDVGFVSLVMLLEHTAYLLLLLLLFIKRLPLPITPTLLFRLRWRRFWFKFFTNRLAKPDVRLSTIVGARICNLFVVPVIARRLFMKDTVGSWTSTKPTLVDGTSSLMSIQETAHTLMNHPATCETPGWQLIAGSRFKPRRDSLEACGYLSSGPSCQPK